MHVGSMMRGNDDEEEREMTGRMMGRVPGFRRDPTRPGGDATERGFVISLTFTIHCTSNNKLTKSSESVSWACHASFYLIIKSID